MPWWAIIYLGLFLIFSIVGDMVGELDGTKRLRWFADLVTHAILAILFAGFWLSWIYSALGIMAPLLFIAAVVWELYSSPADIRKIWQDKELTRMTRIGLILVPPLLWWPLFIVAGVGVFTFHNHT